MVIRSLISTILAIVARLFSIFCALFQKGLGEPAKQERVIPTMPLVETVKGLKRIISSPVDVPTKSNNNQFTPVAGPNYALKEITNQSVYSHLHEELTLLFS